MPRLPDLRGPLHVPRSGSRSPGIPADTSDMSKSDRTLAKITEAFARSVAAGDMRKAEGWLAVAAWSQGVSEKATPVPVR